MESLIKNIDVMSVEIQYLIIGLFFLMVIDIATGVANAIMEKNVMSSKMKKGIVGKIYELSIVAMGLLLDALFKLHFIANSVCIFYMVQEGLSILENTGKYISFPKIIKNVLEQLKEGENNGK